MVLSERDHAVAAYPYGHGGVASRGRSDTGEVSVGRYHRRRLRPRRNPMIPARQTHGGIARGGAGRSGSPAPTTLDTVQRARDMMDSAMAARDMHARVHDGDHEVPSTAIRSACAAVARAGTTPALGPCVTPIVLRASELGVEQHRDAGDLRARRRAIPHSAYDLRASNRDGTRGDPQ